MTNSPASEPQPTAGHTVVRALEAHGIRRVYGVPGESYLEVLDGLHDSPIEMVVCRQEGGAAYMAEAEGKLGARPGVAMVTRGPGAANAMIGLHQAFQDATPLVLFVGLVPVGDRDRESFQEFDLRGWFGSTTKRVFVLDDPDSAGRVVADALHIAASGRPGPVVVGLPEDVIRRPSTADLPTPRPVAAGGVTDADRAAIGDLLSGAARPVVVVGRNAWSVEAAGAFTRWAEANDVPVLLDWRSDHVVSDDSPVYAGWLGYGRSGDVATTLREADALLVVGTVLGDVSSDGFTLAQETPTIVACPDPELRGHGGRVDRHVLAHVDAVAAALADVTLPPSQERSAWRERARARHEAFAALPEETGAPLDRAPARMTAVMAALAQRLPRDAFLTSGAGNHNSWQSRYLPNRVYPSFIATRTGSMGFGVPAGVVASLTFPDRLVVTVVGDGELMMNASELATAVQYGAHPLVVVMDNGQYGTIRGHQERFHPGRVSGTQLRNPDFAALMAAYGGHGERVECDADAPAALDACLEAIDCGVPALVHVVVDPLVLGP